MPLSAHALYFHLSMRADDDGFVNNPNKIRKIISASEDDMKILAAKNFILNFESGVIVIKHWRINNYLRKDRYTETVYIDEKSQLGIKENGAYTLLGIPNGNHMSTTRSPRIEKNREEEISIVKEGNIKEEVSAEADSPNSSKSDSFTKKEMLVMFKEYSLGDDELYDALIDFNKMRVKNRKYLTRRAVEILLSKLTTLSKKYNIPPVAFLEQSILNVWTSVFPIKQDFIDYKRQNTKPDVQVDWLDDYIKEMEGNS
jgi:hypothetical protein